MSEKPGSLQSLLLVLAATLIFLAAQVASADWKTYEAKSYGYSMLVPEGTTMRDKELGGGGGQLWGEHEGVKLYGMAKLGNMETDAEIGDDLLWLVFKRLGGTTASHALLHS